MNLLQVAQRAIDLDRAAAFYTALLGEQPVAHFDPPGLIFFQLGATRLLLDKGAPSSLLYLQVSDVRRKVDDLRSTGVRVETEPHVIFQHTDDTLGPSGTDECQAFIRDTEDNVVGLVTCYPSATESMAGAPRER